jgi:hypothetical protein
MTTSYKLSAIKELKAQKKILREQEAIARIEAGLPVEDPREEKPVEKKEPVKKTVTKKVAKPKAEKKTPATKRGRPKKSK